MIKKLSNFLLVCIVIVSLGVVNVGNVYAQSAPIGAPTEAPNLDLSKIPVKFPKLPSSSGKLKSKSGAPSEADMTNSGTVPQSMAPSNNIQHSSISVESLSLDKGQYSAGDTVTGSIVLGNKEGVDQNDVYLDISLAGNYSNEQGHIGIPNKIYDTKFVGPLKVLANSNTTSHFSYVMPRSVGGKGLGIDINARSISGIPYGWKDVMLGDVKGGKTLLFVNESYTNINGVKNSPQSGPTINATSTVDFHFVVKNPSNKPIEITPGVEIRDRIYSGDLIKKYSVDSFTIAPNSSHDFVLKPYKNDNKPGVYVAEVSLLDSDGDSLAYSEYRYILPGEMATIHEVKFEQTHAGADSVVTVNVLYSGAPHDIVDGSRLKISDGNLSVKILDANTGAIIGEASTTPNLDVESANALAHIKIKGSTDSIKVLATITAGGKVLATYTTSASTPDAAKNEGEENANTSQMYLVLLASTFAIILIVIFYFVRRKKSRNILMSIVILLSAVGCGLITEKYAEASLVYSQHYMWNYYGAVYADVAWDSITVETPAEYGVASGPVHVGGYIYTNGCGNTPEDIWVYADLRDQNGNIVSGQPSAHFYYANHPLVEGYSGLHYSRYYFSIPQNLSTGWWVVSVSDYDHWVGNGLWEHYGWSVDYRWVWIYPQVAVTCAPDKLSANVGDTVTWNLTTSGGTGHYTYYWYGKDEYEYPAASPQTAHLSKIYTTAGVKDMYAAIVDIYTGDNSAVDNGGPWNSCANVNVYSPSSVLPTAQLLANGKSSLNVYVGDVVNYTWSSTNANSATSHYSSNCGSGNPWVANTINGSYPPYTIPSNLLGCNYVLYYDATQSGTGFVAHSVATVNIIPVTPLVQSCSVSAATVNVGQPVTWSINTSGGKAPFTYYMGDGFGLTNTTSITRTYNAAGTRSVNYLVRDANSPAILSQNICPSTLVVAPAAVVANSGPASVTFKVKPNTVNKNSACTLIYSVTNARSCSITGLDGYNNNLTLNSAGDISSSQLSNPIQNSTKFSLACTQKDKDANGNYPVVTKTSMCYINANIIEK